MALTYLLDDPSPNVRLALAQTLAEDPAAPRGIIVSLAQDQPEIACTVIMRSPVLRETDLVDLAGRGCALTRAIIAARPCLSSGVCAALAEIGDVGELLVLLENYDAQITPFSLRRIAERHGADADIRNLLFERDDLPADVRLLLVSEIGAALAGSPFVCQIMTSSRADQVIRDASDAAIVVIAGEACGAAVPMLAEHLRLKGELTPALLVHALCSGKLEFFVAAVSNLSGLDERRVRPILATGRQHSLKALFQAIGLSGVVLEVFLEATMLWRKAAAEPYASLSLYGASSRLLAKFDNDGGDATLQELLHMVEKLHVAEQRQRARSYASELMIEAA